jgi:hypothetical protein
MLNLNVTLFRKNRITWRKAHYNANFPNDLGFASF